MVRTISTKLAVEGEAQFKQSIAACNAELKTLKSDLALVESEFRNNANSMEALTAKGTALQAVYDKQLEKVVKLETAMLNARQAQDGYASRVATAQDNVQRYEQDLERLRQSTEDTSQEQEELTRELDKWNAELAEAQAGQAAAERGVRNWQNQLNSAKIELNGLSDKIAQNKQYLQEAIEDMDLHDEAYKAGVNDIQGLIDGMEYKRGEAIATAISIAQDVHAAYLREQDQHSPSKKFAKAGSNDIQGLIDGAESKRATVEGNNSALVSVTGFRVNHPDEIRVTITRWSLPGRRMRAVEIVPGVYEVWTGDEMCEFNVKHQGDPTCLTLPYGTASIKFDNLNRRFDPRTKDGVFLMIEERQGIDLYMGPGLPDGTVEYKPLGTFYQSNRGWMTGDNAITMGWNLVDIIGLIAQRTFIWDKKKPMPTTLKGWLEALAGQLGENFTHRVLVDPEYAGLPAVLSREAAETLTCGNILRYVCMATGTWPRADASTGYLAAGPLWDEGNKITLDNLNKYPTMSANEDAAAITVNGYTIEGNAPSCGNTVEVSCPFLKDADRMERAKALLSFYGGNRLETLGRGDPASEIGDVDAIWLAEGNATSARRMKQELSFRSGVLMNCKSEFVRGEGWFRFTSRERFLESGTWTVPEGVWQLRIILIGHGGRGTPGGTGGWENRKNQYMGKFDYPSDPPPREGSAGAGGKVWTGVIDVNPGQVIQIQTGEGVSNTTLWNYSSANGKSYPNGFTDVATGDVYARPGAGAGPPGSGNGGSGGRAGTNGSWHIEGIWVQDDGTILYPGQYEYDEYGPGHWDHQLFIDSHPTTGTQGGPGATGSAIIYWEPPEVIDDDDT